MRVSAVFDWSKVTTKDIPDWWAERSAKQGSVTNEPKTLKRGIFYLGGKYSRHNIIECLGRYRSSVDRRTRKLSISNPTVWPTRFNERLGRKKQKRRSV
jgi:hypothetical protein